VWETSKAKETAMKAIILAFLLQLEAIGAADPALLDLNVLAMANKPIRQALIEGSDTIAFPRRFGMTTEASEQQLRGAVLQFIQDAKKSPEFAAAKTAEERVDLLYADGVSTPKGQDFDDYFAFATAVADAK
jgi:hypothetical protein